MKKQVFAMLCVAIVFLLILLALFSRRTVIERKECKELIFQADSLGFIRGIKSVQIGQEIYKKPRYIRLTKIMGVEAVIGQGYPTYGLYSFDVDVSTDECKTWFHLFDDKCVNNLPNYFIKKDSLQAQ